MKYHCKQDTSLKNILWFSVVLLSGSSIISSTINVSMIGDRFVLLSKSVNASIFSVIKFIRDEAYTVMWSVRLWSNKFVPSKRVRWNWTLEVTVVRRSRFICRSVYRKQMYVCAPVVPAASTSSYEFLRSPNSPLRRDQPYQSESFPIQFLYL